jgi:hypothetical protein
MERLAIEVAQLVDKGGGLGGGLGGATEQFAPE